MQNDCKTQDFFKTEAQSILERWLDSEYMKDLYDCKTKKLVAILLENQKLSEFHDQCSLAKLTSLVREVYPNLLVCKIASCQPSLGPTNLVYYYDVFRKKIFYDPVISRIKKLDLNLGLDFGVKDRAVDIINEIDKEVLEDLFYDCNTNRSIKLQGSFPITVLREGIAGAFEYFKYKNEAKISANWMVVSENLFKYYGEAFCWDGVNVYVNKNLNGILYGYKGHFDDCEDVGYVYSPYIPFTYSPLMKNGRFNLITRYSKKLLNADYYGKILVT